MRLVSSKPLSYEEVIKTNFKVCAFTFQLVPLHGGRLMSMMGRGMGGLGGAALGWAVHVDSP
jgi:hypothetical protein